MANVKLKSIFTKEDIYTVLQLLKALADGVDENDTNMQAQIDELKQKIATLKPEPEGYAVDNAGNVTINDILHVNKDGNTEVDGKAYFCGKNALIYHGTVSTTIEGSAVQSTVTALMMNGPAITIQGEEENYSGAGMVVLASQGNDFMVFLGIPLKVDSNGTKSPATLEDVYNGNWEPYTSIASCKHPIMLGDDNTATIDTIYTGSIIPSGGGIPTIGSNFVIGGTASNLANVEAKATGASQAKYQHTVHITTLNDVDKQLNISFTAMSSKNIYISSYQSLHEVFGGCKLTVSGNMKYYVMQVPLYLDLHGGTQDTDKIYCSSADSVGAYQQPTLSTFPNITFTDDVCIPK